METRGRYGKGFERSMYHDVSMCLSLSVVFEGNHLVLRQWGSVIHPLKSALPLETLPEWILRKSPELHLLLETCQQWEPIYRWRINEINLMRASRDVIDGQQSALMPMMFYLFKLWQVPNLELNCFDMFRRHLRIVWTEFQESLKGMTLEVFHSFPEACTAHRARRLRSLQGPLIVSFRASCRRVA